MAGFLDAVKALSIFPRPYPHNVMPAEISGGYYGQPVTVNNFTAGTLASGANEFFAIPFITREGGAVSSLAFFNTSAGETGRNIRTGIYSDSTGLPLTLLAEASVTTLTAAAALREPSISITLSPNTKYWYAMVADGAFTYRTYVDTNSSGFTNAAATAFGNYAFRSALSPNGNSVLTRTFTYAALPSTWGTPSGFQGPIPMINWKKT